MRADPFIQRRVWGGGTSVVRFPQQKHVAGKPIYSKTCPGCEYSVVTFPQRKHVAGTPIYSKTRLGWQYIRSNISSTETRYTRAMKQDETVSVLTCSRQLWIMMCLNKLEFTFFVFAIATVLTIAFSFVSLSMFNFATKTI